MEAPSPLETIVLLTQKKKLNHIKIGLPDYFNSLEVAKYAVYHAPNMSAVPIFQVVSLQTAIFIRILFVACIQNSLSNPNRSVFHDRSIPPNFVFH